MFISNKLNFSVNCLGYIYVRQLAIEEFILVDLAGLETFIGHTFLAPLSIMSSSCHQIRFGFQLVDIDHGDIAPAEYSPPTKWRFADLNSRQYRDMAVFFKRELIGMFDLFHLPAQVQINNGNGCSYNMTSEEKPIFGLTKIPSGTINRQLYKHYFWWISDMLVI